MLLTNFKVIVTRLGRWKQGAAWEDRVRALEGKSTILVIAVNGVAGQSYLDTYLRLFPGSPLKPNKRKMKNLYHLHFNFCVYKEYFITLIQEEIKHLPFINEGSSCSEVKITAKQSLLTGSEG